MAAGPVTWQILRGLPPDEIVRSIRRQPRRREVHRAAHSVAAPLALMVLGPTRPLGIGCASHVAVDLITHHSDAWPHLWPFDRRVWRSPLSYWERERGGLAFRWAEVGLLVAGALTERHRHRQLIGLATAACATVPLVWEVRRGLRRRSLTRGPAGAAPRMTPARAPIPAPAWRLRMEPEGAPADAPSRRAMSMGRTGSAG